MWIPWVIFQRIARAPIRTATTTRVLGFAREPLASSDAAAGIAKGHSAQAPNSAGHGTVAP